MKKKLFGILILMILVTSSFLQVINGQLATSKDEMDLNDEENGEGDGAEDLDDFFSSL